MYDAKSPRILVVEDDPTVLELLTTRLEIAGYRTSAARDGVEALEVLPHVQPDAMILDLNMPKLDGFGVLSVLSRRPPKGRIPVLVVTARHGVADVKRCLALGAKDFLSKPFDDKVLLARVARLVHTQGAPRPAAPPAPLEL